MTNSYPEQKKNWNKIVKVNAKLLWSTSSAYFFEYWKEILKFLFLIIFICLTFSLAVHVEIGESLQAMGEMEEYAYNYKFIGRQKKFLKW